MNIKENKVLVQIGTYNGGTVEDDFDKLVKQSSPSKVVLVEPNAFLNDLIWKSYAGVANVFLENAAIIAEDKERTVQLVYPKNNVDGASINGIHYGDHNFSLIPMDNWGNDFEVLEVKGIPFANLCKKYGLTDIHFLQIDAEGYDSEIIKSIDFGKVNIDMIKYEYWPFDEECFSRHGDKAKLYGRNGMEEVRTLLESLGYVVTPYKNGTRDIVAVKNN